MITSKEQEVEKKLASLIVLKPTNLQATKPLPKPVAKQVVHPATKPQAKLVK